MRLSTEGEIMDVFHLGEYPEDLFFDGQNNWVIHKVRNKLNRISLKGLREETYPVEGWTI